MWSLKLCNYAILMNLNDKQGRFVHRSGLKNENNKNQNKKT